MEKLRHIPRPVAVPAPDHHGGPTRSVAGPTQGPRNQFGTLIFVAPEDVHGTLAEGFRIYQRLSEPLHRAIFMMFLVSEVHPFADGNGRVARIMMNAELLAARP